MSAVPPLHPAYPLLINVKGGFLLPDGDSIRFVADHPLDYRPLHRVSDLHLAIDGSVQLRLYGLDAPELHYLGCAQPLAVQSRDALVHWLTGSVRVTSVPCSILASTVDGHGRPIAFVLHARDAAHVPHAVDVDSALLHKTANAAMLRGGHAYPLAYMSMAPVHRAIVRVLAHAARRARKGVWSCDVTRTGFDLRDFDTLCASPIVPKLFRRCVGYLRDRSKGFRGSFIRWLEHTPHVNDKVLELNARAPALLSNLLVQRGDRVTLGADPIDLTFVEP